MKKTAFELGIKKEGDLDFCFKERHASNGLTQKH